MEDRKPWVPIKAHTDHNKSDTSFHTPCAILPPSPCKATARHITAWCPVRFCPPLPVKPLPVTSLLGALCNSGPCNTPCITPSHHH
eukprot:1161909-Pelagomonas_calceolata.AAC.5